MNPSLKIANNVWQPTPYQCNVFALHFLSSKFLNWHRERKCWGTPLSCLNPVSLRVCPFLPLSSLVPSFDLLLFLHSNNLNSPFWGSCAFSILHSRLLLALNLHAMSIPTRANAFVVGNVLLLGVSWPFFQPINLQLLFIRIHSFPPPSFAILSLFQFSLVQIVVSYHCFF